MPSKLKPQPITTKLQFTAVLDEAAALQLDIETRVASLNERLAALELPEKAEIERLKEQLNAKLVVAESYAAGHQDELLNGETRSAETARASWGFRLTPPALKQASRAWTVARTVETLSDDGQANMLRVKTELDKEAIKAAWGNDPAMLLRYGLTMTQNDEFWMEPKRAVEAAA